MELDEVSLFSGVNTVVFLLGVMVLGKKPFWMTLVVAVLVFFATMQAFKMLTRTYCPRVRTASGRIEAAVNKGANYVGSLFQQINAHKSEPSFTD